MICGYGLPNGVACSSEKDRTSRWCPDHTHPRFTVCVGCGQPANHQCMSMMSSGQQCMQALCDRCVHADNNEHQPVSENPFAAQEPSPLAQTITDQMSALELEWATVCATVLTQAGEAGNLRFTGGKSAQELGAELIKALEVTMMAKLMSGVARGGTL
jgi:hypothetical protein